MQSAGYCHDTNASVQREKRDFQEERETNAVEVILIRFDVQACHWSLAGDNGPRTFFSHDIPSIAL